jgi:hypothetical protein
MFAARASIRNIENIVRKDYVSSATAMAIRCKSALYQIKSM